MKVKGLVSVVLIAMMTFSALTSFAADSDTLTFQRLTGVSREEVTKVEIRSGTSGDSVLVADSEDINIVFGLLNSGVYTAVKDAGSRGGWSYLVKIYHGENVIQYIAGYGVKIGDTDYLADNDTMILRKLGEMYNKYSKTLSVGSFDGKVYLSAGDKRINFLDVRPFIDENGRTQTPVRATMEALDASVDWNDAGQTVTINKNGVDITLTIGSDIMTVNGKPTQMDTAAVIIDEHTYVPVRYVAEAMGYEVKFE